MVLASHASNSRKALKFTIAELGGLDKLKSEKKDIANRNRIQIEPLASVSPQGVFLSQGNHTARALPASYIVAFAS